MRRLARSLDLRQLINIVISSRTPALGSEGLSQVGSTSPSMQTLGYGAPCSACRNRSATSSKNRTLDEDPEIVVPFKERQRLVDKPFYDGLDQKYA